MSKTLIHVSVVVPHENSVLLVRETGGTNLSLWNLPGGHLEFGEDPREGACRETLEETGLSVTLNGVIKVYSSVWDRTNHAIRFVFVGTTSSDQHSHLFENASWWPYDEVLSEKEFCLLSPKHLKASVVAAFENKVYPLTLFENSSMNLSHCNFTERFIIEQSTGNVNDSYEAWASNISKLLPFARVEHIGSTAIPGAIGKGDLDILVLVDQEHFKGADAQLARIFERNLESDCNNAFSSFKNDLVSPPLGIQLTVRGSEYDNFLTFRDILRKNPELLEAFNQLRRQWNGKLMQEYRAAKAAFISTVLSSLPE